MSKLKWKQLVFLVPLVIGTVSYSVAAPARGKKAKSALKKASPTAKLPLQKVVIALGEAKGMDDTGKIQKLSDAIKKYPKHDEVKIWWITPNPYSEYSYEDWLTYNRRKGTLEHVSSIINFNNGEIFSHVTDKAIHSAGKVRPTIFKNGQRVPHPEPWVSVLLKFGCKLTTSYVN